MKSSVMTPTIVAPAVHPLRKCVIQRRELLLGMLAASLAITGCKRGPRRYEVYYYYLPY